MRLTRPSNTSAPSAPALVEPLYSLSPDVLKPNAQVQATLTQLIETWS